MKFSVIVADCPWSYEDKLRMQEATGTKRSADSHYPTMLLPDIMAIPVEKIAADDCILALWVPNSLLQYGLDTMKAWGFTQKQMFVWVKTSKKGLGFGMGRNFRNCSECALIGTKGKPKLLDRSQRNVSLDLALPHSQKPETLQNRLEIMYEGPYLELFARRKRDKWICLGNEIDGKDINDAITDMTESNL